uniref:Small ribosomal subunit protein uS5 n=1 Tax=Anopheles stephensi TaxID=30069 RepID=A0A182YSL2_ANOST
MGRLVKDGKIRTLEEIYLYSLPIKEFELIDFFLNRLLMDEVLKMMPVQKQTRAGQRTRLKAFVAIGDSNGHIGLGVKWPPPSVVPSSWPSYRSVLVRLIPAPRGTGIVSAPVPKKLLQMAVAVATYAAIAKTYAFLTPDLWKDLPLNKTPYQEFVDFFDRTNKTGTS